MKGNWFAQRLEWTVVCQRSRSPHLLMCELKFIHSSGAIYEHIVWMNCLSLTATPLCDLSVCERQLIRTKVRMDSSLSAQPIASFLSANWNSFTHQVQFTNTLCEWIVFRWQSHRYVICLSAKGNWFAQRLGWAIVCQRSRSPHLLICVQILTSLRPLRTLPGMHLIKK